LLTIIADKNIPRVEEAFGRLGRVIAVEMADITPRLVHEADILLVRSEVKVNGDLLNGSSVRFVGTTTIGFDHLDTAYLANRNIRWANAPGCNANSVGEYITAALFQLSVKMGFSLRGKTLGVVGVGNVGSKVVRRAESLGMRVIMNDPPLLRATGYEAYRPIDEVMGADIVTIHVPLTHEGEDRTYHLFDARRIAAMKPGAILINSSRGGVVETASLKEALRSGKLAAAVLDVWEDEPDIDVELLELTAIATPHIAGYSLDGKMNAVRMIYNALCHFLTADPLSLPSFSLPPPDITTLNIGSDPASDEAAIAPIVASCYDIMRDDRRLRSMITLKPGERAAYFRSLRRNYPVRREFMATMVTTRAARATTATLLRELGFSVSTLL
jgi:erythronate-4-phosphate dehydrogenase